MVMRNHGKLMLKTVEGEPLTVSEDNGHLFVSSAKSGVAEVTIPDVMQSNGVIQVISSVLLPN
jgi:uncharacterized surface protein with fasciclin (FAS1) repeats